MGKLSTYALMAIVASTVATGARAADTQGTPLAFQAVQLLNEPPQASQHPAFIAIHSQNEWAAWWQLSHPNHPSGIRVASDAPPVIPRGNRAVRLNMPQDAAFSQYTYLVAESGPQANSSNGIMFQSVRNAPNEIIVSILETTAVGDCIITPTISYPFAMARIRRTAKPIRFDISRANVDCRTNQIIQPKGPS